MARTVMDLRLMFHETPLHGLHELHLPTFYEAALHALRQRGGATLPTPENLAPDRDASNTGHSGGGR